MNVSRTKSNVPVGMIQGFNVGATLYIPMIQLNLHGPLIRDGGKGWR